MVGVEHRQPGAQAPILPEEEIVRFWGEKVAAKDGAPDAPTAGRWEFLPSPEPSRGRVREWAAVKGIGKHGAAVAAANVGQTRDLEV